MEINPLNPKDYKDKSIPMRILMLELKLKTKHIKVPKAPKFNRKRTIEGIKKRLEPG